MATFPIAAILDGRGTLGGEYEIVHRAAMRHARNYVAFDYLRRRTVGGVRSESLRQGESAGVDWAMPLPIQTLMGHALANPSDISRLSFLQHVLRLRSLQPSDQEPTTTTTTTTTIRASTSAAATVQHILDTTLRLRLRGDAIWTFLRLALVNREGAGVGDQERLKMLCQLREWRDRARGGGGGGVGDEGEDVKGDVHARDLSELRTIVQRSLRWIARWEGLGVDVVDVVDAVDEEERTME